MPETTPLQPLAPWVSLGYAAMLVDTMDARASGELPDAAFIDVRYADLMTDPAATVGRVYERLDVGPPPGLDRAIVEHLAARPRRVRGVHEYALSDTGLELDRERRRFRRYQAAYDIPDEL